MGVYVDEKLIINMPETGALEADQALRSVLFVIYCFRTCLLFGQLVEQLGMARGVFLQVFRSTSLPWGPE